MSWQADHGFCFVQRSTVRRISLPSRWEMIVLGQHNSLCFAMSPGVVGVFGQCKSRSSGLVETECGPLPQFSICLAVGIRFSILLFESCVSQEKSPENQRWKTGPIPQFLNSGRSLVCVASETSENCCSGGTCTDDGRGMAPDRARSCRR